MIALISSFFRTIIIINLYKNMSDQKVVYVKHSYFNYLLFVIWFLLCTYTHVYSKPLLPVISILLFTTYAYSAYRNRLDLTFVITGIAHSIYYVTSNTISLLVPLLLLPSFYLDIEIPYLLILITCSLLTQLTTHSLLKIKRLKSGLSILTSRKFINITLAISLLILALKIIDCLYISHAQNILSLPIATLFLALLLFTWWQKQITKSYIDKLRKLEVQSLYDELEEKERLILKLTADNQSLSRIIHKDNKLIPAMEHAVMDFLTYSNFSNPEKLKQYGNELTYKLHDMAQDRQRILTSYENEGNKLKLTGHVGIDAILVYMNKIASDNHITFECKHSPENMEYLLSKISEEDLTHLLSDLLENALISMQEQENGRLVVVFGKFEKEAYISVADSGINFNIDTLHSLGLRPHTTHADSGGSGIGLMDIWNLKKKYRATIQIQELEKTDIGFTKNILFSFNSKNHYVIQSYRHTEITNTQTRGDLYVIPTNKNEKNGGKTA